MTYYDEVRATETEILNEDMFGYHCEVVEVDGHIVLYADGYFAGELYDGDYIPQIEAILM